MSLLRFRPGRGRVDPLLSVPPGVADEVGELVGFFVTAGNARNVTDGSGSIVYERSNVITIPFPADPGAVFTF